MSGGRSSSRSSSATSTQTDNSNTQINDNQGTVVSLEGNNNRTTIVETDHDAIGKAFDFGKETVSESLLFADETVDEAFSFGGDALKSVNNTVNEAFLFGDETVDEALAFGGDALDKSLSQSFDFGREVISDAQNITRNALNIAGNAQTNAFAKIREIAESFTSNASGTRQIILAVGAGVALLALALFFLRKR